MPEAFKADSNRIIVIGGSSGAFTALRPLLSSLPADLPAAIFVVLHTGRDDNQLSADLLAAASVLPVRLAKDGGAIEAGTVTLARADHHLLLGDAHVHTKRGPRENNFRPAVDPLFRSAAVFHGPRTIGLVLSGSLDDGAAGALALERVGGTVLAQAPDTASFPSMPEAVLDLVSSARAVNLDDIPAVLSELAASPAEPVRKAPPEDIVIEMKIAGLEGASMAAEEKIGTLSPFNCPDCNGVLWEIEDKKLIRYRCHTGHAFTMRSLSESQSGAMERSLYDALRAHRGRIELIRKLITKADSDRSRQDYMARVTSLEQDAELIEQLLMRAG
ncbi:MAG: chemotaxis protein CheB [Henriciella sp.]|uniref:chemotaxis protein CheB n=1 Tax=Henriciella sp. TaxID=1968823 RepID=UPI003C7665C2